ncbi:MAG: sodium-dependent transporter [Candidatus Pacearchaeota archaeon]
MKLTQLKIFRSKWSSEKAFVLSTAAAAVGLGNLWRFPYLTGENGGAAFIIAYVLSVILIGLPLMIMEIGTGKFTKGGPIKAFETIKKKAKPIGIAIVGVTLLIMSYYFVITGWTLNFAVKSLFGSIPSFGSFTSTLQPLLFFGIVVALGSYIVAKGVKVIEKMNIVLMPLLFVIVLGLTAYSLTLGGAAKAISFLFEPDFASLLSPSLWLLALGQAFYSLAVGQGYLMTYGSFLKKKFNVARASGSVAAIETTIALLSGIMIFPLVFTFGLNPGQGTELAFTTLPVAFSNLPFGAWVAPVFFFLFFFAALSSCIAGMEVVKTGLREQLKLTHGWATAASFLLLLPLGILSALSFSSAGFEVAGRPFLEVLDLFTANQLVIGLGLLGGAIVGWFVNRKKLVNSFGNKNRGTASRVIKVAKYAWVVVLLVLILSLIF